VLQAYNKTRIVPVIIQLNCAMYILERTSLKIYSGKCRFF